MNDIQGEYKGIEYTTTQITIDELKKNNIDLIKEIKNAIDEIFIKNKDEK